MKAWKYRAFQAVLDAWGRDEAWRKVRLERSDVPSHIRNLELIL